MAPASSRLRLLQGDEDELFRTHEVALRAAVRHHALATEEVIEDACAYAWLELCLRQPDRDNVFAWLRRVAIRQAWRSRDREQRDRRLTEIPADREPRRPDLSIEVHAHEVLAAIGTLSTHQRTLLTLFLAGHSYDEISDLQNVSTASVNKALVRARRHLRPVHDAD
jgi:RNA polymerase sigma factor (sigma-70 family)